jgi:hypothetical protein
MVLPHYGSDHPSGSITTAGDMLFAHQHYASKGEAETAGRFLVAEFSKGSQEHLLISQGQGYLF